MSSISAPCPFDIIDNPTIAIIASFLFDARELRKTCRRMVRAIEKPRKFSPHALMIFGARTGHFELCELAKERGGFPYKASIRFLAKVSAAAAASGCIEICKTLRLWTNDTLMGFGEKSLCKMYKHAARNGYRNICELAYEWEQEDEWYISEPYDHTRDYFGGIDFMLTEAAIANNRELCETARMWLFERTRGGPYYELISRCIFNVARAGRKEMCLLILSWATGGLSRFTSEEMFLGAIRGGHRELCNFMIESGIIKLGTEILNRALSSMTYIKNSAQSRDMFLYIRDLAMKNSLSLDYNLDFHNSRCITREFCKFIFEHGAKIKLLESHHNRAAQTVMKSARQFAFAREREENDAGVFFAESFINECFLCWGSFCSFASLREFKFIIDWICSMNLLVDWGRIMHMAIRHNRDSVCRLLYERGNRKKRHIARFEWTLARLTRMRTLCVDRPEIRDLISQWIAELHAQ